MLHGTIIVHGTTTKRDLVACTHGWPCRSSCCCLLLIPELLSAMCKSAMLTIAAAPLLKPSAQLLLVESSCRAKVLSAVSEGAVRVVALPFLVGLAELSLAEVRGMVHLEMAVGKRAALAELAAALKKVLAEPGLVQLLVEPAVRCLFFHHHG